MSLIACSLRTSASSSARLLTAATLLAATPYVRAADLYYLGAQYTPGPTYPAPWPTEGSWFDKNLWQNNTLPTSTTNAIFGSDQTMPNGNTTHAPHILHFGNFGYFGTTVIPGGTATLGTVTLLKDNWTFDFASAQNPGFTGILTPSIGRLGTGTLLIGPGATTPASLTVSNGTLSATTGTVGYQGGTGQLILNNSAYVSVSSLRFGDSIGSKGYGSLIGGQLVATSETIAYSGTFTQIGGLHTVTSLTLGTRSGAGAYLEASSYTMSGGQLSAGIIALPGIEDCLFRQSGGTVSITGTLSIGDLEGPYAEGRSVYALDDGQLSVATCIVGNNAYSGAFTQGGGTNTVTGSLIVGDFYSGTYTLSAGLLNVLASETLGGHGTFIQSGGTHTVAGSLSTGVRGVYNLSGGTLTAPTEYWSANGGIGSFTHTGGTHIVSNLLAIGASASGTISGTYALSGSGVLSASTLTIGGNATAAGVAGTLAISGGMATVNSLKLWNSANSTLTLSGGTLAVNAFDISLKPAAFGWTGGTLLITGVSTAPITVPTAGTCTLGGTGTLTGDLTNKGTLGATGTLTGNIVNNGTLSPGGTPGVLTLQGNYAQSATATMMLEIAGTATSAYDHFKLTGTGSLTLGGAIAVSSLSGFAPAPGDTFDFLDWTGTCTNNSSKFDFTKVSPPSKLVGWDTSAFFTTGVISVLQPAWTGKLSWGWYALGNWNTPAVPDSAGQAVVFGQAGAGATVDLGSTNYTVGTITFNGTVRTNIYGIDGGSLVLDNGASAAIIAVTGSHSITAKLKANSDLSLSGTGTLNLDTINLAAGKSLSVAPETVVITNSLFATNGLTASINGSLKVNSTSAPRGTSAIALKFAADGLTIGTSGSLDITNHDLLLRYSPGTGATALSTALSWLQSSKLKSTSLNTNQALACVNNAALATPFTTFDGIALADANQILIKYTWKGDANLDGKINFNDYLALDAGYLFGGTDWTHGDFTGDSQVTLADYVAIDAAFLAQNQVLASDMIALHADQFGPAYTEALASAIPEPATLALLALATPLLLTRRKSAFPPHAAPSLAPHQDPGLNVPRVRSPADSTE